MELSLENTAFFPHLFILSGAGAAIQSETSAATDISRETCGRSEEGLARCALIGKTRGNRDTRISSDYIVGSEVLQLFTILLRTCCSSIFISSVVDSFLHKNSENKYIDIHVK